jgi:glycosyltransferase involved in cell wall biosynthesis
MHQIKKASVILSFYNEENVLAELIKRLRNVFSVLHNKKIIESYELIFVNDNSTDNSENLLRAELISKDIVIINMSRNFGTVECLLAGMENSTGDIVIYMDADLQDPPELIEQLIFSYLGDKEAEIVYTTRNKRYGEHWLKLLITKIGYRLIKKISDIDLQVDSGDFKLLSRRAVNEVLKLKEDRPYMRGLVSWIGFKQIQVFYDRDPRFDGAENTKNTVLSKRVIYYWIDRALISFSDAPLKLVLFIGIIFSLFSSFYIFVVIAQKIMGISLPGWSAIMASILMIGSIQILMLGFIGLYVGSIFRETKNRPKYIIKEIIR